MMQLSDMVAGVGHEQVERSHRRTDFGIAEVARADEEQPERHRGMADESEAALDGDADRIDIRRWLRLVHNGGGAVLHRRNGRRRFADHFLSNGRFADRYADQHDEESDCRTRRGRAD